MKLCSITFISVLLALSLSLFAQKEKMTLPPEYIIPQISSEFESFDVEEYITFLEEKSTPSDEAHLRKQIRFTLDDYNEVDGKEYVTARELVEVTLEDKHAMSRSEWMVYHDALYHWGRMKEEKTDTYSYHFKKHIDRNAYYSSMFYKNNSIFRTHKYFHENGNIKTKKVSASGIRVVGMEYRYDEQGILIKEIDHEQGWGFTTADVMNFCYQNKIAVNADIKGWSLRISKWVKDGKKYWSITSIVARSEKKFRDTYILDGDTGKQIGETEEFHMAPGCGQSCNHE